MKKYATMALIAFFTMSFALSAQNQPRTIIQESGTPRQRAENMARQLELTTEQTAQVQALFEKREAQRVEQMAQLRRAHTQGGNQEELRTLALQIAAAQDAELEELKKIIGKEKLEKWQKYRAERTRNINTSVR